MSPKTVRPFVGPTGARQTLPPHLEPRVRWGDPPPRPVLPVEGQLALPLEPETEDFPVSSAAGGPLNRKSSGQGAEGSGRPE